MGRYYLQLAVCFSHLLTRIKKRAVARKGSRGPSMDPHISSCRRNDCSSWGTDGDAGGGRRGDDVVSISSEENSDEGKAK